VETCLDRLREGGLLIASNAKPPGYLPRRAPESIRVDEILACMQPGLATPGRESRPTHESSHVPRSGIDDLVDRMRHARAAIVDELTMKDLAELGSTGGSACKAHKEQAPSGSTNRSEPYRSEPGRSDTPWAADRESGERSDGPQLAKPGAEVTQDRYPPPSVARDEPDEQQGIRPQMRRVSGGSDEQS
jgi:DNA-binding IscR family transcriptional regulator